MAQIQNSSPIVASTFSNMWIQQLQIFLPQGNVQANFLPCDGTHLLATGGKGIMQIAPSGSFTALIAEVKTLANKTVEPTLVQVFASDPTKPVSAQCIFSDKTNYRIADIYALAATDATFAGILGNTLVLVAGMAGYVLK